MIIRWTPKEKETIYRWQQKKITEIINSGDVDLIEQAPHHPKLTCRPAQAPYVWVNGNFRFWIFMGGRGTGKALCVDTPILTSQGWKRNGDLVVGDKVFDEKGELCTITKAHPPFISEEAYRVHFSDGTHLDACKDHLWVTYDALERKKLSRKDGKEFPVSWANKAYVDTKHLFETQVYGNRGDLNHCIPLYIGGKSHHRMITKVERIESKLVRCITVDSPNSMYLAGESLIPTHNTHAGTQWVWHRIENATSPENIGIVAPDYNSVLKTIILGPSGLMQNKPKHLNVTFAKSDMIIEVESGFETPHRITFYTSENPERIRGANFTACWLDEVAAYKSVLSNQYTEEISQAVYATRIGNNPQIIVTSTPKNFKWLRDMVDKAEHDDGVWITIGSSLENAANLGVNFIENIKDMDRSSPRFKQEVLGELILTDTAQWVDEADITILPYSARVPTFHRVILTADTAYTEKHTKRNDPSMICAWGVYWNNTIQNGRGGWSILLLDVVCGYYGLPELIDLAVKLWNSPFGIGEINRRYPDVFLIENASSGRGLQQILRKYDIPAQYYTPDRTRKNMTLTGKQERFANETPQIAEGKLSFIGGFYTKYTEWQEPYVKQLVMYPALDPENPHDEFIDNVAIVLSYCRKKNWVDIDYADRPKWSPAYEETKDDVWSESYLDDGGEGNFNPWGV